MISFIDENDVRAFINNMKVEWIECPIRSRHMKFSNVTEAGIDSSLEELSLNTEAMESKICLETSVQILFIRPHALTNIFNCLGIGGPAIKRMSPEDKRILLNKCVKVNSGTLFFKVDRYGFITYCGKEKPNTDWLKLFEEVRHHAMLCHASFLNGKYQDGKLFLTYANRTRTFHHVIDDAHGLMTKEEKEEKKKCVI